MQLIQILLPLKDNHGKAFPSSKYRDVQQELTEEFGGSTAFIASPAEGHWEKGKKVMQDDIVIFEVMTRAIDKSWWKKYRSALEKAFRQEEIIIRAHKMELL